MIYQKCEHCGAEWHGFEKIYCPYCRRKVANEEPLTRKVSIYKNSISKNING